MLSPPVAPAVAKQLTLMSAATHYRTGSGSDRVLAIKWDLLVLELLSRRELTENPVATAHGAGFSPLSSNVLFDSLSFDTISVGCGC